jgi:hypothetical protein
MPVIEIGHLLARRRQQQQSRQSWGNDPITKKPALEGGHVASVNNRPSKMPVIEIGHLLARRCQQQQSRQRARAATFEPDECGSGQLMAAKLPAALLGVVPESVLSLNSWAEESSNSIGATPKRVKAITRPSPSFGSRGFPQALVSEEVFECEDDATMDDQESENGRQSKAGRGSAVYDLEYIVDMKAECKPYPPISHKVMLDEEYKCEEPESDYPNMLQVWRIFLTIWPLPPPRYATVHASSTVTIPMLQVWRIFLTIWLCSLP